MGTAPPIPCPLPPGPFRTPSGCPVTPKPPPLLWALMLTPSGPIGPEHKHIYVRMAPCGALQPLTGPYANPSGPHSPPEPRTDLLGHDTNPWAPDLPFRSYTGSSRPYGSSPRPITTPFVPYSPSLGPYTHPFVPYDDPLGPHSPPWGSVQTLWGPAPHTAPAPPLPPLRVQTTRQPPPALPIGRSLRRLPLAPPHHVPPSLPRGASREL